MDMGGMSMPSGTTSSSGMTDTSSMMGMSDMMMVFFTSTRTPLYSKAWTPASVGAYAATCIFLIVLSFVFRGLLALRVRFSQLWNRSKNIDAWKNASDLELGVGSQAREPWRVNKALVRAILDTVIAGVSYLLMLAVMTMNVGYFMSILGGAFLGSFVMGGWVSTAAH